MFFFCRSNDIWVKQLPVSVLIFTSEPAFVSGPDPPTPICCLENVDYGCRSAWGWLSTNSFVGGVTQNPCLTNGGSGHPDNHRLYHIVLVCEGDWMTDNQNRYNDNKSESKMKAIVTQSCPTLYDPVDCSPPGSSVHGILQARVLEWVATSFSRGSSQPRDQTQVSCIAGGFFTAEPPEKPPQSVQLLSHVGIFSSPGTAACQASLAITNFWSSLTLMFIESVMPSNHLILCRPFLLLPSIFPSIRVFSNESKSIGVSASASVLPMNTQD